MRCAIQRFGLALAMIGFLAGSVDAGSFTLSGQLGTDVGAVTGLAGGSFDGNYSVTGLPVPSGGRSYFDSFNLDIKNSSGQIVYSLSSSSAPGAGGGIGVILGGFAGSGTDVMLFEPDGGGYPNLNLPFTSPFNGDGQVIPTDPGNFGNSSDFSGLYLAGGDVNVASGVSSPFVSSVPEPSSLTLTGIAGVAGVVVQYLRCRKPAAL